MRMDVGVKGKQAQAARLLADGASTGGGSAAACTLRAGMPLLSLSMQNPKDIKADQEGKRCHDTKATHPTGARHHCLHQSIVPY